MTWRSILPNVLPGERTRFVAAIGAFSCVAAGGILARTMGNTVFLTHYGAHLLPLMYIGTAIVLTVVSYIFGSLSARFPVSRLIVSTASILFLLALAVRTALGSDWGGWNVVAYFLSDLVSKVPMMLFWTFAALVFNPREAKRLFGFIGAAGTLSCVVAGFIVKPFATTFGTRNLLLLVAALLFGFALSVAYYVKKEPSGLQSPAFDKKGGKSPLSLGYYFGLFKGSLVRNMALLAILSVIALTVTDFMFKSTARAHYSGPELAGFFGVFFASTNFVALALQLFLVHLILQRGGVLMALLILPAGLLVTSLGIVLSGGHFGWIVAAKFVDPVFDFTINSAALSMLYLGIKKQTRGQARGLVDGISKPAAVALAGGVLFVLAARIEPKLLSTVLAPVVAVAALGWVIFCVKCYRSYVSGLIDSLGARQFDLSQEMVNFRDKTFESHLRQALLTASDEEIPYLLGVLPELGYTEWTAEYRALLSRESATVKVEALDYLSEHGEADDLPAILYHLDHESAEVRASAARAASMLGGPKATEPMEKLLGDPAPIVRAAAAVELINIGDLDGLLSASVALKSMLTDKTPETRMAAGDALAHIRHGRLTRALSTLLADANNDVRLAALNACRSRPDLELLPFILPLLGEHQIGAEAAETVASFGSPAIESLVPFYDVAAKQADDGTYRIPGILAKIGNPAVIPLLRHGAKSPDLQLRREAVRSYCRVVKSLTNPRPHFPEIDEIVAQETEAASARAASLRRIEHLQGRDILEAALRDEYDWHLEHAFALLALKAPDVDMKTIFTNVTGNSKDQRAEALEVLDNVLDGPAKQRLLSLLESETHKKDHGDPGQELHTLVGGDESEWIVAGALALVASDDFEEFEPTVTQLLDSSSPIVRETALHTLSKIASTSTTLEACRRLEHDSSPVVRDLARKLPERLRGNA